MKRWPPNSVEVTVSDGKNPAGDADTPNPVVDDTITVTITVTDVNEGPTFTNAQGDADIEFLVFDAVEENTASNVNIGSVVAMDPDTKATNMDWKTFTFGFKNRSDDDLFSIDEETGLLTTDENLEAGTWTMKGKETMR